MGGLSNLCGSPKTKLKGITGSGWGADTGHIFGAFRDFFSVLEPMQAAPFKLGYRHTPPLWGGTVGWLYTYQGCDSNFLDCYFLDHSPCPRIDMDVWSHPGKANVDKKRFKRSANNQGWGPHPEWWDKVMGKPTSTMPAHTIQDFNGLPAEQTMYSYFFRPKYEVRKTTHERIQEFDLSEQCAVMHVRRGDSIMHTGIFTLYLYCLFDRA